MQKRKEVLEEIELLLDEGKISDAQHLENKSRGIKTPINKIQYEILDKIFDRISREKK